MLKKDPPPLTYSVMKHTLLGKLPSAGRNGRMGAEENNDENKIFL
jgi:hypothetical protein